MLALRYGLEGSNDRLVYCIVGAFNLNVEDDFTARSVFGAVGAGVSKQVKHVRFRSDPNHIGRPCETTKKPLVVGERFHSVKHIDSAAQPWDLAQRSNISSVIGGGLGSWTEVAMSAIHFSAENDSKVT